jgi:protease IV
MLLGGNTMNDENIMLSENKGNDDNNLTTEPTQKSESDRPNGEQQPVGYQTPTPKKGFSKPLLIIGGILLGIIIIGGGCKLIANQLTDSMEGIMGLNYSGDDAYVDYSQVTSDHIAVVFVEGVISASSSSSLLSEGSGYDHNFILDSIDLAINNDANKGLMLYVNSPGGGVYESDELYLKIKEYQDLTGRPVYTYMGPMAASGGYYIAAPSDKIIANRNCWTGSIGVTMGTYYDISGLLDKYGVKSVTITAGRNKAMGSYTDPMTPEQLAILQSLVDEAYDQFVSIVAEGRGMDKAQVIKLADGRVYTAKQAKALGLVDEINTFDQAIATMQKDQGLTDCNVFFVTQPTLGFLDQLLGQVKSIQQSSSDLSMLMDLMAENGQMPIAYMSDILN